MSERTNFEKHLLDSYSPLQLNKIIPTSSRPPENAFEKLKTKPDEGLDYNISETEVIMKYGDIRMNLKQTIADYVPVPIPKPKQIKRSHVGKVQWKYIDEIRREKEEELQTKHKKDFEKFIRNRKRIDKLKAKYQHNKLMDMVGPDWYQELSSKQLAWVDYLEYCISKDYMDKTINNSQEFIANLGLVPRPSSQHIRKALQLCMTDPVQFLLILYQLINPKRKSYSVNDRLLLSAVVHLTMSDTLQELHVRIPSPPRKQEQIKKVKQKRKKNVYKSPYLEPFNFKPERTSAIGDFEKKILCYPESPYFSYIDVIHYRLQYEGDPIHQDPSEMNKMELDIFEDMEKAQTIYNRLHGTEVNLLMPKYYCNIYIDYDDDDVKKFTLPSLAKLEDKEIVCECKQLEKELYCCHDLEISCDCDEEQCECKEKSKRFISYLCDKCRLQRQHKNARNIITGIKLTESNTVIPIVGGTFIEKTCDCLNRFKEKLQVNYAKSMLQCQSVRYVMAGLAITKIGPVYVMNSVARSKRIRQLIDQQSRFIKKATVKHCENNKDALSVSNKKTVDSDIQCTCQKTNNTKISVISTSSTETITNTDEVKNELHKCENNNSSSSRTTGSVTTSLSNEESNECKCKAELDKYLTHRCTCEKCNVEQRRLNATYLMSGVMEIEDEDPVSVIAGIRECRCDCLRDYIDKIKKLEDYRQRIQVRYKLKSQPKKYAIGGVYNTCEGPQYLLTGMRPSVKCICAETMNDKQKREHEEQHKAKMPDTGRIKYGIAGVQYGSKENVYIVTQALPNDKCSCEKLYDSFVDAHRNCLDYYDKFLETIAEEELNYENDTKDYQQNTNDEINEEKDKDCIVVANTEVSDIEPESEQEVEVIPCKHESVSDNVADQEKNDVGQEESDMKDLTNSESDDYYQTCSCPCKENSENSLIFDARYAINLDKVKRGFLDGQKELKRYVIMEKFPCLWSKWRKILEKVLHSMAEDGFSLAKLPECYKLPHFKLWMCFRCRKTWTPKEMADISDSFRTWNHTNKCYKETKLPNLGITPRLANKLTWKEAEFCKKLIYEKYQEFYRNLKRQRINAAREFFPTTSFYKFPNKNFRDCFFAYLPCKEEDIFVESLCN